MLTVVLSVVYLKLAQAQLQSCANGGIGPCLGDLCPSPTARCITTASGRLCCESALIINVTTPEPTTTSAPCMDLVHPQTGISDCPNRAYLCNNSVYYTLMTQQCPRTCNRCGSVTTRPSTGCIDRVNPSTGVSDCPNRAYLCNNSVYYTLMTQQCPKTCNRCP